MNEEITTDEQTDVVIPNAVENTQAGCQILTAFRVAGESLDDAP